LKKLNLDICEVSLANNFGHMTNCGRGKRKAPPREILIMINELLDY